MKTKIGGGEVGCSRFLVSGFCRFILILLSRKDHSAIATPALILPNASNQKFNKYALK